jgi:hypothetical protein
MQDLRGGDVHDEKPSIERAGADDQQRAGQPEQRAHVTSESA